MQFIDLYQLLGVSRHASAEELKKAFRNLARSLHPDIDPSPNAKERFQVLNQAYQILSDPIRRRMYNLQYDRLQALKRSQAEKAAEEDLFDAPPPNFYTRRATAPPPPPPVKRKTRTTQRQPGEPYVSMADIRQRQFIRFIPTVRTVAMVIWVFLGIQMIDRVWVKVGEIEEVYESELRNSGMSGTYLEVVSSKSTFREDIFGSLGLEATDLIQFERTWMFKRNTVLQVIHTRFPNKTKIVGGEYANRVYYPWYFLTIFLLFCSLAAYFLPDTRAELRFKFALACAFFCILYIGIQFVF